MYYVLELLARGRSHPAMFVAGGFCFVLIGCLNEIWPKISFFRQIVVGAVLITVVELFCGVIVNIWLGFSVWDYSSLPLNLYGQICLPYCLLWLLLAGVAVWLDDFLRWKLFRA